MAKTEKTKQVDKIKPLSETLIATPTKTTSKTKIHNKKTIGAVVKFKKLHENAEIPTYAHDGDIGMDIKCVSMEYNTRLDSYIYHTGLACETERGVGCYLMPRSSNVKTESYLPNSIGLIDTFTYRGELCFVFKTRDSIYTKLICDMFYNWLNLPWYKKLCSYRQLFIDYDPMDYAPYKVGDRIGQMVFFEYPTVNVVEVDELSVTERGEGGFGSTGK